LLGLRQVAAQPTRQPSYRFRCFTPLPGTRGAAPSLAHAHLSADSSCRLRTEEALAHVRPVLCRKRIALPSRNAPRPLFPSTHRVGGRAGMGGTTWVDGEQTTASKEAHPEFLEQNTTTDPVAAASIPSSSRNPPRAPSPFQIRVS
jgi:hypothetical protein